MRVVIIGSGNVATVFGKKIKQSGHEIVQVVGRNKTEVTSLAAFLNASTAYNIQEINLLSDIYIIAVSDNAIEKIAGDLLLPGKIVVHTAASVPGTILKEVTENYGVIYPLQSLKKETGHFPELPVLITGANDKLASILIEFSSQWTDSAAVTTDQERLKLHVAAVILNNFSNHLFTLTADYCSNEGLDFNLLQPLINETIERIKGNVPSRLQTGPAVRNDTITIQKHQQILQKHHLLLKTYNALTSSIRTYYDVTY